jgi:hypothetical protein
LELPFDFEECEEPFIPEECDEPFDLDECDEEPSESDRLDDGDFARRGAATATVLRIVLASSVLAEM